MKGIFFAAMVAAGLGSGIASAQAIGPVSGSGMGIETPVTQASAARERRIYMMQAIQAQQMRHYRRHGYGHGGYGHGGGYGYGRPYGGGYGYGHRRHHHHHHGW